jgi:transcriptional regulator with XRE-family HTH domain
LDKIKKIPKNNVLRLIRRIRDLSLHSLETKCKVGVTLLSSYENDKLTPSRETISRIANSLEIKPEILLYAYGYLPEKEMNIIRSDPYYYMDKIQKMCKNHDIRYSEENVNIDDLNMTRTYEYIIKSMEDKKNESKSNT